MTIDQTIQTAWQELRSNAHGTIDAFQGRHLFLRGEIPSSERGEKIGAYFDGDAGLYVDLDEYITQYFGQSQYQSTYVLLHKKSPEESLMIIYGCCTTQDEFGRDGYHCITLQGAYHLLKQTFQYFQQHPLERMNQLAEFIFKWSTDQKQSQRRGHEHIAKLNDVAQNVYVLEIDHKYSFLEKLKIKFRGNKNVKRIEI